MASARPRPKNEAQKYITLIVVIVIPIVSFVGGVIATGFTAYEKLATKPWVEEQNLMQRRSMEERIAAKYKDAVDMQEKNRSEMTLKFETMLSDLKVRNAIVDTKIETLIKATTEIKDYTKEQRRK